MTDDMRGIVRKLMGAFIVCFGLCMVEASAQAYPVKPVRVILGTAAGGSGDISARMLTQKMVESLGQPIIVEARPGAGGAIADEAVARSPPDGHTLLYAAGAIATLPALRARLPYDVERDFAPISLVVLTVFTIAVHPSVPVRDAQGLIALARTRPGQLTFSSPGIGSSGHLAGEAFVMMAGVKILHVPYKGAPEAIVGVVAGEIDVGVPSVTGVLPFVNQGKLKVLAVTTLKRSALMPSVPTLDESGLRGYQRAGWNGFLAPAGVPREIITRLNTLIVKTANAPEMREAMVKRGFEVQTNTPEEFAAFIRSERAQNAKLVKFAGIKIE
ncbi:MAG: tripartite tricarboxylate transporter substrate binding protein [Betaproteobacteria bacterium]|nr:tripartite tricarboxylate transporter substrate binding protein [Betaproteobacteria bacterium]